MSDLKVQLASMSLIMLAADTIESFDEGTVEAEVANACYELVYGTCVCSHPWRFSIGQGTMSKENATPIGGWSHVYRFPPKFVLLRNIITPIGRYDIFENSRLYTDWDGEIIIDFQFLPEESVLPPYFKEYFTTALAAKMCFPLTADLSRVAVLEEETKRLGRVARGIDSQQRVNRISRHKMVLDRVRGSRRIDDGY